MKWGVRRYQNADGSLTEKGKKRRDKTVIQLNETQRSLDAKAIDKNYLKTHKARRAAENAIAVGGIGGLLTAMSLVNVPMAAVTSLAFAGGLYLNSSKHISKVMKKKFSELEKQGTKVSERPTTVRYTHNGNYRGQTMSKRYNVNDDTSPYKEDYQLNHY